MNFQTFSADVHSILPIKKDRLVVAFSRQSLGTFIFVFMEKVRSDPMLIFLTGNRPLAVRFRTEIGLNIYNVVET